MPLHLKKLCVGISTIDELRAHRATIADTIHPLTGEAFSWLTTRNRPKRDAEILGEPRGSLYWVIARLICVRQEIITFRPGTRADGSNCIHIDLDHKLVLVKPRPHRPFQGWRYLEDKDAPEDVAEPLAADDDALPPKLARELATLGLL